MPIDTCQMSERLACPDIAADGRTFRFQSCRSPDTELSGRVRDLAKARQRLSGFGFTLSIGLSRWYNLSIVAAAPAGSHSRLNPNDWHLPDVRSRHPPEHVMGEALEKFRWQHALSLDPFHLAADRV
jgi:hypothetical protein